MKNRLCLCFCVMLLCMGAGQVHAATMDINGYPVELQEYVIEDGTTMVSEDFLKDELHLSLSRNQDEVTFSNDEIGFSIQGKVGDTAYTLNEEKKIFSKEITEKDGKIYLPLRSVAENFGGIGWDGVRQAIKMQYDYNGMVDIPKAQLTGETVEYEKILNGGMIATQERMPVAEERGSIVFEERDINGDLKRVYSDKETLIEPFHTNYAVGSVYGIDENFTYWVEYPQTENDHKWYMYIKSRAINAKEYCVSEGDYTILKQIPYATEILNNVYYLNGKIAYLYYDDVSNLEVRFYDNEAKENKVLDRISLQEFPNATMYINLNDSEIFWNKILCLAYGSDYGTMYRYDIATQETMPFYKGCNLSAPVLLEDYLIVRNKPMGRNFIYENEKLTSGELWVYSLKEQRWICKIDNTLPIANEQYVVTTPVVLDKNHITFCVEGVSAYEMPIVDLRTGGISIAKSQRGEPLLYSPVEREENCIADIRHVGKDMYYATILEENHEVIAPMKFNLK